MTTKTIADQRLRCIVNKITQGCAIMIPLYAGLDSDLESKTQEIISEIVDFFITVHKKKIVKQF